MTPRLLRFHRALTAMYEGTAAGNPKAVWIKSRYERLKARGFHSEAALTQAQHEAQVRFGQPSDRLPDLTPDETRSELTRLRFRAEQLTVSLRQLVMTAMVRQNVEQERDEADRQADALERALTASEGLVAP